MDRYCLPSKKSDLHAGTKFRQLCEQRQGGGDGPILHSGRQDRAPGFEAGWNETMRTL
jgi:hypothetical protein